MLRLTLSCGGLLLAVSLVHAQIPVPAAGCYHAAFTPNYPAGGAYGHQDFTTLAKKSIAIEMFYTGWPGNRIPDFPLGTCNGIVQLGSIPHITWEPWVSGSPFPLDGIIDGSYNSYLLGYALQVKSYGKPLFIRIGHEMNGDWYPWGGKNNGGATLTGFGDPAKPDGPERFVAAFRRVRRMFDSLGVTNVAWIWCPNNYSTPYEDWNQPENYYPGDDAVDWIGFDGYNWGTSQTWSGWTSFYDTFKDAYARFKNSPKPLMIGEFASAEVGGDKGQWIRDAFLFTQLAFPRIKAITWFNINKETDWRINSSEAALSAYQQSVASDYFLSTVSTTAVAPQESSPAPAVVLLPPSPNPANAGVWLQIASPSDVQGRLSIFNLIGQEVAVLEYGTLRQGNHTWFWNARARDGREVASGVYIAVLQAAAFRQSQKVVITK